MKILQVTNFFKPSWESGGPARVVYGISKGLIERGHDVTVYATDGFKWKVNMELNKPVYVDGIKTYFFRNASRYLAKRPLLTPYYMPFIIQKEIKNYDIIHLHELCVPSVIVHYFAKKYGIPYVLQAHGDLPFHTNKQRNFIGRQSWSLIGRSLLLDAAKVIALTETEAEQYVGIGLSSDKIEIVPNGIDINEYVNLPRKGEFRKRFSIINNENIILYVGRLNKSKGIDILIRAFSVVEKELPNIKLVLIGPDDGHRSKLITLIKSLQLYNKVLFCGFVNDDEKLSAFIDADVFVTPCFSGFPMTFLEACTYGIPIITTKKGDELNWIHNNVGMVAEYNMDSLTEALIELLRNDELRKRFGRNGKELIIRQFNWASVCRELEAIYLDAISQFSNGDNK